MGISCVERTASCAEDGESSAIALKGETKTVSLSKCRAKYDNGKIDNTMMCAYIDKIDTCYGDSGGPLVGH